MKTKHLLSLILIIPLLLMAGYAYTVEWGSGWGTFAGTSGTPADDDFAKFTDANTIEGRSYAETREDLDLEAGTDFYSKAAEDTWRAGVTQTEMGYVDGVTSDIQDQFDLKLTIANPTFTGTWTVGSAAITEPELEILDGLTITTAILNYLDGTTGVSGTDSIARTTSPTFVTPTLGAATATSLTLDAHATPAWPFRDLNCAGTDKEIAKIYSNATTTTDGAEDGEQHLQVMDSGTEKTYIQAEATTNAEFVDVGPPDCTYDMHTHYSVNAVDGTYSGDVMIMTVDSAVTNSVFGQLLHVDTDGELIEADADVASAGSAPGMYILVEAGTGAKKVLRSGIITETDWTWSNVGGLMYIGSVPATSFGMSQIAAATTGDQVQVLGQALSADTIDFRPSPVLVEVP